MKRRSIPWRWAERQRSPPTRTRAKRKRAEGDSRPRIPYVSHLLGVCGLVIEDGGDTDEAIAGLLHDYLEDVPGADDESLAAAFGSRVRQLVEACTGPKSEHEPDFRRRKQTYLDHLTAETDTGAVRVSLADKVHNARSTVNDLEADGSVVWDRFNAGAHDQIWWYDGLAAAYATHAANGRADTARAAELRRLVARMRPFA
jgi:(p)ppGpp synthase/HD superfamily hydrolase